MKEKKPPSGRCVGWPVVVVGVDIPPYLFVHRSLFGDGSVLRELVCSR